MLRRLHTNMLSFVAMICEQLHKALFTNGLRKKKSILVLRIGWFFMDRNRGGVTDGSDP